MSRTAMFEQLIFDDSGRPVEVGWVGDEACYVVDDAGFKRHIDAEQVDKAVLQFFKEQIRSNKEMALRSMLEMMGKDDIFTKTALEYQLEHMDEAANQMIPPQARGLLAAMGFKIIIDVQGNLVDIQMPEAPDIEGLLGPGSL